MKLQELRDEVANMKSKALNDIRLVLTRKGLGCTEAVHLIDQVTRDTEADIQDLLKRERFNVQAEPVVQIETYFRFTVEGAPAEGDYVEVKFNGVMDKVLEQTGSNLSIYQENPEDSPDDWTAVLHSRTESQNIQAISVFRSAMGGLEQLHISQRVK